MSLYIYVGNILLGTAVSIFAILYDAISVPYSYDQHFSIEDLIINIRPLLISLIVFLFFRRLFYKRFNSEPIEKSSDRKNIDVQIIFFQIFILIYSLFKIYLNKDSYIDVTEITRYLIGKENYLIMIVTGGVIFNASKNLKVWVVFYSLIISIIYAWFGSTREALIPIACIILYYFHRGNFKSLSFSVIVAIYIYSFISISRGESDKFDFYVFFDSLSLALSYSLGATISFLGYTFGYSVMHFAYVKESGLGEFYFRDLIYSLTPIPSFLLYSVDSFSWRVDVFRPMGAMAEIYRVSELYYYLFVIFIAKISAMMDSMTNEILKLLCLIVFALLNIMLYQYGLRTNMWFILLITILLFVDKMFVLKGKKA